MEGVSVAPESLIDLLDFNLHRSYVLFGTRGVHFQVQDLFEVPSAGSPSSFHIKLQVSYIETCTPVLCNMFFVGSNSSDIFLKLSGVTIRCSIGLVKVSRKGSPSTKEMFISIESF